MRSPQRKLRTNNALNTVALQGQFVGQLQYTKVNKSLNKHKVTEGNRMGNDRVSDGGWWVGSPETDFITAAFKGVYSAILLSVCRAYFTVLEDSYTVDRFQWKQYKFCQFGVIVSTSL